MSTQVGFNTVINLKRKVEPYTLFLFSKLEAAGKLGTHLTDSLYYY